MKVILYSTKCPKCGVLEKKLNGKNIEHTVVYNIDEVTEYGKTHGILSAPILEVDGEAMDFVKANAWINKVEVN